MGEGCNTTDAGRTLHLKHLVPDLTGDSEHAVLKCQLLLK